MDKLDFCKSAIFMSRAKWGRLLDFGWAAMTMKYNYNACALFWNFCLHLFLGLYWFLLLAYELQIGPDMLISGFLQPFPDPTPVIPSVDETYAIDPSVTPYESSIIFFYKTWDLYGAFSNFSPHPIQMPDENGDYQTWSSVEHYYQVTTFAA